MALVRTVWKSSLAMRRSGWGRSGLAGAGHGEPGSGPAAQAGIADLPGRRSSIAAQASLGEG